MKIGDEIKRLRIKRGLTQKQLGEMCGMADSAIRKYESGKVKPKIEAIKKLASALQVDPYSLTDFDTATEILEEHINNVEEEKEKAPAREEPELSEDEAMLLSAFRSLTEDQKRFVLRQLQAAAQDPGDPGAV